VDPGQAVADLGRAREYIVERNPTAAIAVVERIEVALASLAAYPTLGRKGRVPGTRELVVTETPFIVPYRVTSSRIEILAVIHGARRWPESL
jgi:plasmid stabilization system protein ParE